MASYITRNLRQVVTIWKAGTPDGFGGHSFTRRLANCRWENKSDLFRDPQGNEGTSDATVYLDTDVSIGDYIYLGTSSLSSPVDLVDTREVKQFDKSPNLQGTDFERKAKLKTVFIKG